MTREQQRQLKELKTALPKILKEEISSYKIKKRAYMLYGVNGDMFFTCHINVSAVDNVCLCTVREQIKPIWLDDLNWKLLGMESNSKQPLSLRAVGAFSVLGVNLCFEKKELHTWSADELRLVVSEYVAHFNKSIENGSIDDFVDGLSENNQHNRMQKALYLLHEERYADAFELIKDESGSYINGVISINETIRKICQEHLQ